MYTYNESIEWPWLPDSKVHVAHMGPTWVLSARGGPHVGPMNLAIRVLCTNIQGRVTQVHEKKSIGIYVAIYF